MKKYILNGLDKGIEAYSKESACGILWLKFKIGATPQNLIEVEEFPSDCEILN